MRKNIVLLFLLLFLTVPAICSFTLEVGADFHIGNLTFDRNRSIGDRGFTGTNFNWGLSTYVNHPITEDLTILAGYYMDPILRKRIYTRFTYNYNFLTIGVGPFAGVFNSFETLIKPGISTYIRLDFPGVVFLEFQADSSMGGRMIETGEYFQERTGVSLGYYVPHAICAVNIDTSKYTSKTSTGEVIDKLQEYTFSTDIFKKNAPYKIFLAFGFQRLSKIFIVDDSSTSHSLGSIIVDTRADFFLPKDLTLFAKLKSSVYTFGLDKLLGLSNPGPGGYLFEASIGFSLSRIGRAP
jgi:hypothetical protein